MLRIMLKQNQLLPLIYLPPDIIKPAIKATALPPINIKLAEDDFPEPFAGSALMVSFIEDIIVGISFTAPIKPPESIIPAPIYFT